MCPALFQELTIWQSRQMVIHSYPGQRRKLIDGAFRTGKAQLTKTPQATVRSREVILSADESQWRLSGRAVIWDFI